MYIQNVFQGGSVITIKAFDSLTARGKLHSDVLDFGIMQKIPKSDLNVISLRCQVFSNFNPKESNEWKYDFVTKEMKGKNPINFFQIKALFIPIFDKGHYSLAVIISPNGTLVILKICNFCILLM
jgi:Ulp1 family protease